MERLKRTIDAIPTPDRDRMALAQRRLDNLTKPLGSLGRLEELAAQLVGITGQDSPSLKRKVIITMAGDHGVVEDGVSAYPKEVTPQMVYNFLRGGAGVNVLARQAGARVIVVDMGVAADLKTADHVSADGMTGFRNCKVAPGTRNFTKGPAMTRDEAVLSIVRGIEVVESEHARGLDIIGTGDMGIGNTTPSAAVLSILTGIDPETIAGRGTGVDDKGLARKVAAIRKGIEVNRPDRADALDVLAKVGGFEIGGICGVMLGAAARRVPVLVDGFISCAGAFLAVALAPRVKHFLIASHCSAEKGHGLCLEHLGLQPLLDLGLRLGEGTGAALAMHLVEAAVRILTGMATFEAAGVAKKL
ncbi:MAG: nicotinate-nucleotide--dimethylbenzimidazole phosphoribosyltransferase [Planctomycetota bacterium]|nr:nicotinate-nucleotide--dimethylbenzimidazole phosphoribosyltransferase [Planctomycetota bacterium]